MTVMKMKRIIQALVLGFLFVGIQVSNAQSEPMKVDAFTKVIISPHIEVEFQKGTEESVTIISNSEKGKLNIEVNSNTLRIYLDDAKMTTKSEKVDYEGWKQKVPIYDGTVVKAIVTYTNLEEMSLRGEEDHHISGLITGEKFALSVYGEGHIVFDELNLEKLKVVSYGESEIDFKSGIISKQKFTLYGEGEINSKEINNQETKLVAYGEGEFNLNVEERLKVTAYGEAEVYYTGRPNVSKGIVIGEATIKAVK